MSLKYKIQILLIVFGIGLIGLWTAFIGPNPSKLHSTETPFRTKNGAAPLDRLAKLELSEAYGKLPLSFEPNPFTGTKQAPPEVRFISKGTGYTLFLTQIEAVFALSKAKLAPKNRGIKRDSLSFEKETFLHLRLLGSNQKAFCEGVEPLPGKSNYLIGNDPSQWRTNVSQYGKVKFKDVYHGIDMVYYGHQGKLEYDFVVQPGIDPKIIQLSYDGTKSARVVHGDLILKVDHGEVAFKSPVIYQMKDGQRQLVQGRYAMTGKHRVGFEVQNYDTTRPLVIDPALDYSTFLEGNNQDIANAIVVDNSGNAYITGSSQSPNFPLVSSYQGFAGTQNAFITKLNAAGSALIYSTFLGGNGTDSAQGITVDGSGNVYLAGFTNSGNFPTVNSYQVSRLGLQNVFVSKLNPSGNALIYSTYLGGSNMDWGQGIALDSSGCVYVTGYTQSSNFPYAGSGFQSALVGAQSAFVTKLSATGNSLVYSTYLGGTTPSDYTYCYGIALDTANDAYIVGATQDPNGFPTTAGAIQTLSNGGYDGFFTQLNPTGTALLYSTYLGGSGTDDLYAVAVDGAGNAYVAGDSYSGNFPTTNAYQATLKGTENAVIAKFNSGNTLVYSTYIGGGVNDCALGIAADSTGSAYITGRTDSVFPNFPASPWAFQTTLAGNPNAFVSKFDSSGALVYSSYLGGSGADTGNGIAVDGNGSMYIAGKTSSSSFPTVSGSYDTVFISGNTHAFVTKFDFSAVFTPTITSTPTPTSTWVYQISGSVTLTSAQPVDSNDPLVVQAFSANNPNLNNSGTYKTLVTTNGGFYDILLPQAGTYYLIYYYSPNNSSGNPQIGQPYIYNNSQTTRPLSQGVNLSGLPINLGTTSLTPLQAFTGIAGTFSYTGAQPFNSNHQGFIQPFNDAYLTASGNNSTSLSSNGNYQMVMDPGTYYLRAFIDEQGSNQFASGDPFFIYGPGCNPPGANVVVSSGSPATANFSFGDGCLSVTPLPTPTPSNSLSGTVTYNGPGTVDTLHPILVYISTDPNIQNGPSYAATFTTNPANFTVGVGAAGNYYPVFLYDIKGLSGQPSVGDPFEFNFESYNLPVQQLPISGATNLSQPVTLDNSAPHLMSGIGGTVTYTGGLGPVSSSRQLEVQIFADSGLTIPYNNDQAGVTINGGAFNMLLLPIGNTFYLRAYLQVVGGSSLLPGDPYQIWNTTNPNPPATGVVASGSTSNINFNFGDNFAGTVTPVPTYTNTPTSTPTKTSTNTPTNTPTNTITNTATATPTNSPTNSPTNAITNTPTDTPTTTPTDTPTITPTDSPTITPTPSNTFTPTMTALPNPGIHWTLANCGAPFGSRSFSSSVVFNGKFWMTGGINQSSTIAYNDIWSSTDGLNWVQVVSSAPFSARAAAGLVVLNGKMWIIGGFTTTGIDLTDVWSSPDGSTWTQATASAAFGVRKLQYCAAYNGALWVIGGQNAGADVWTSLDGATWTEKTLPHSLGQEATGD